MVHKGCVAATDNVDNESLKTDELIFHVCSRTSSQKVRMGSNMSICSADDKKGEQPLESLVPICNFSLLHTFLLPSNFKG